MSRRDGQHQALELVTFDRAAAVAATSWVMRQSGDETVVREVMMMLFQPPRGTRQCRDCNRMVVRAGTRPQVCHRCSEGHDLPG